MDKMKQKILCIKSEKLFKFGKWNGLKTDDLEELYDLLLKESEFRPRGELEEDPSYKQIIPQVVLKFKDRYFLHRQVDGNESRLNSLHPLPLGGHVEEFDANDNNDLIQTALLRELDEEAEVDSNIIDKRFLGIIYLEDNNPVNLVHIGIMYIFELDEDLVELREDKLEKVGFVDLNYLKEHINELTYWSRELINSGVVQ